jgi:hypothetical protein
MPISIRYKNDPLQDCVIRPAPLVSISDQVLRNNEGSFGKTYAITLTGYIIVDLGFPLARDSRNGELFPYYDNSSAFANAGPHLSFDTTQSHNFSETPAIDNRPDRQYVPYESAVDAMFFKQRVLRELFNRDGQRLEIIPIHTDESVVICYPRFVNINFEEGIYTDYCKYTVQLECDILLDKNDDIDLDGILIGKDGNQVTSLSITEDEMVAMSGRFVEGYTDTWSVDASDSLGETIGNKTIARSYTITRNISATGKDHYGPLDLNLDGTKSAHKKKAWEQARDFVQFRLQNEPVTSGYPNFRGVIGSGILNLVSGYQGFNHTRNESVDITGGNYSVTETWLMASGMAYENYNSSVSVSTDSPFINVSMRGEIRGLNSAPANADIFGGNFAVSPSSTYENALSKYYQVSNSGKFGVGCDIFKRANNLVGPELNAQPKSVSISYNQNVGEISYALEFDNRPRNILSGVLMENISLTDTYPGDVFATIQVPGRKTGPILQPIGTRTQYRRDLNIDFVVDYTDLPYGSGRSSLLLQKPSLVEPIRSQLIDLVNEFSPEREYGIRKWYINAPVENWTPKVGNYSLQLSWTYELNK